jgi:hypothetical protein
MNGEFGLTTGALKQIALNLKLTESQESGLRTALEQLGRNTMSEISMNRLSSPYCCDAERHFKLEYGRGG